MFIIPASPETWPVCVLDVLKLIFFVNYFRESVCKSKNPSSCHCPENWCVTNSITKIANMVGLLAVFTWIWETHLSWSRQIVITGRERDETSRILSHLSIVPAGDLQSIKRLTISKGRKHWLDNAKRRPLCKHWIAFSAYKVGVALHCALHHTVSNDDLYIPSIDYSANHWVFNAFWAALLLSHSYSYLHRPISG